MSWPVVLFDLDGTLVDTGPGIMRAAQYALQSFGVERQWQTLTFFVGPPLEEAFAAFFPPEQASAAVKKFREYYNATGWLECSLYPGIEACLQALRAAGKRLCVATSKPEAMALRVLEHVGLLPYFEAVCGALPDDPAAGKKAQVIGRVLLKADCAPEQAVMVGDRQYDVLGGHAVGLQTLGVLYGYGSREELEQAGADGIAATPPEIVEWILHRS